ncbi:MAG TPA: CRISPR-associated endonuclease Cas1, partial [Proteobacteria bacterium]|nr:CRISPR-associated endonuclease Cas1 [Pseudomonadota bacterium]
MVSAKIFNQRVVLKRFADADADISDVQREMARLASRLDAAEDMQQVRGIEGAASRAYFRALSYAFERRGLDMPRRSRRPPKDPANALLSFAYGLLRTEVMTAIALVGLDPYRGFYHSSRYGRPALALDIMEEFRPALADSTVLGALGLGMVGADDFESRFGHYRLTEV